MIDSDGVEWYRYDMDHWSYNIDEVECCGKVTPVIDGLIDPFSNHIAEYHFNGENGYFYVTEDDVLSNYFASLAEAENYIENHKKETATNYLDPLDVE